jgi:type II secretion system protein H
MKNKSGFTLIEMTIVMMIIAIASSILSVAFTRSTLQQKLEVSAWKLSSFLNYAKAQSMRTGKIYRVSIDKEKNKYQLEVKEEPKEEKEEIKFIPPKGNLGEEQNLERGIFFKEIQPSQENIVYIMFFPNGSTQEEFKILLSNKKNEIYTLKVDKLTGTTYVIKGEREIEPPSKYDILELDISDVKTDLPDLGAAQQ